MPCKLYLPLFCCVNTIDMDEIIKQCNTMALETVQGWSDFRIQTSNPLTLDVLTWKWSKDLVLQVQGAFPQLTEEELVKHVRAALLNAMHAVKVDRIARMQWSPYDKEQERLA